MTAGVISVWLPIILMLIVFIGLLKVVMHGVFGRGATSEFMGRLMYDVFLLPFRCIGYLFRRHRGGRLL